MALDKGDLERAELLDGQSPRLHRELEVKALIARGFTNRQIATEMKISDRTVAVHANNILKKLGFTSRFEIAAWARERYQSPGRAG